MGRIAGHSFKDKPAKGLSFLLKYSDLESCFTDTTTQDIYIMARFRHNQSYWKEDRDRLQDEGRYRIAMCSYHSGGLRGLWKPPEEYTHWLIIDAEITSIPSEIVTETRINRAVARDFLNQKVHKYTQQGFNRADWFVVLSVLAKTHEIECRSKFYSQPSDTIETVSLQDLIDKQVDTD